MRRETILLTKYVLSAIHAFIWSKVLILLCGPALDGVGVARSLFVAALIAGASALFMFASIRRFVGAGINPHTYSMNRDSYFGLWFDSLVWLVIFGLLISLILWKAIFLKMNLIVIGTGTLFWTGQNGFFLDLPAYPVLLVFLVNHRKADLSSRILNDQSCVFDSWW